MRRPSQEVRLAGPFSGRVVARRRPHPRALAQPIGTNGIRNQDWPLHHDHRYGDRHARSSRDQLADDGAIRQRPGLGRTCVSPIANRPGDRGRRPRHTGLGRGCKIVGCADECRARSPRPHAGNTLGDTAVSVSLPGGRMRMGSALSRVSPALPSADDRALGRRRHHRPGIWRSARRQDRKAVSGEYRVAFAFTIGYAVTSSLWWLMLLHTGLMMLGAIASRASRRAGRHAQV